MATNRDLLKEAIADAKAVKETAIANAKAALEEAFTPFLKEKLSAKLSEMEEEDESMYEEAEMDEAKMEDEAMEMDEVSLDELLAELEEEDEMKDENYMEEELYEAKEEEEEEMNIEDMTEDDLKSFIEDVIKDMVSTGELEAGEGTEEGEEDEESEEVKMMDSEEEIDEEIDINELLAEIEEGEKEEKLDEYATPEMSVAQMASDPAFWGFVGALIGVPTLAVGGAKAMDALKKAAEGGNEKAKKALSFLGKAGKAASSGIKEEEKELNEALETVKTLQSELNEINILNAKLLYTNKIFRNKSLTESQKVKVLTAFDKAASKKEVELVYETLLESLKTSTTKAPIKESLGSASKVLGGPTSKPIIENDAFARMRELAFGGNK